MTRQNIALGSAANDGTGDTLRQAGQKINENFVEIYQKIGNDSDILAPGIAFDSTGIIFEGDSVDANELTLRIANLTGDRTATFPDITGDVVVTSGSQTISGKTLSTPTLTTPRINDASADHQYRVVVSELSAHRNVTLPLLTGHDEFTFNGHTQTLENKTLDSATINNPTLTGEVLDANGADLIKITATGSAINEFTIANAASGAGPTLSATGDDTNIKLNIQGKNNGTVEIKKVGHGMTDMNSTGGISNSVSIVRFTGSSTFTATLAAGAHTGEIKYLINSSSASITVDFNDAADFAQGTSFNLAANGAVQLIWDGSEWYILGPSVDASTFVTIT